MDSESMKETLRDPRTWELEGKMLIGAGIGSLVAGPIGLIVGGAIGATIGWATWQEDETKEVDENAKEREPTGNGAANGEDEE